MSYRKKIWLLVGLSAIVRLAIAASIELGNDEVYYYTYAQHLQLSYFDHPPLVACFILITTANLLLQSEVFVRLGAVIASAIGTFIVYKTGALLYSRQAGWYAALLYNSSLYCSIVAGTFILPDSPQMIFWLTGIWLLLSISKLPVGSKDGTKLWWLFGLVAGLCMMSKLHGVFLWIAASLYIFFLEPGWLKYKTIYLSALVSLLVISPLIIWNVQNNFISYTYHSGRVDIAGASIRADGFIRELGGAILYTNPFTFFLIFKAVVAAFKGKLQVDKKQITLLLFCGLPLISVLLMVSLFKDTLPHWSGPAYTSLIFLPAIQHASFVKNHHNTATITIKAGLSFILMIVIVSIGIVHLYPGTLSQNKQGIRLGEGDPTLDIHGWKQAGTQFKDLYVSDTAKHIMPALAPIIVDNWFPAAHIDFYIASITGQQTYALGNIFDLHHYLWLNSYKKLLKKGGAAYYIIPSNTYKQEAIDAMNKRFNKMSLAKVITQYRNGAICRNWYVYRMKEFH
jgi:4-amino-4-deoxy-L-arabinose transferase-like glycosyltransferase